MKEKIRKVIKAHYLFVSTQKAIMTGRQPPLQAVDELTVETGLPPSTFTDKAKWNQLRACEYDIEKFRSLERSI